MVQEKRRPDEEESADQVAPEDHSAPEDHGVSEDHSVSGNGGAAGGPEDPTEAEQSPTGEDDPEQNPPLPRAWN